MFPIPPYLFGNPAAMGGGFSPLSIASLVEWWSVEDLASVGDGNPISSWVGRKAGITPTSTGTARPTYVANASGGQPAVVPDAVDDTLAVTVATNVLTYFPNSSLEVWAVCYQPSSVASNGFEPVSAAGGGTVGRWLTFSDNTIYFDTPNSGVGRLSVAQPAGWDNNWHVVRLSKQADDRLIEVDGTSLATGTRSGNLSSNATTTFSPVHLATGLKLRQLLLFNNQVSGSDLTSLRTYLNTWKA